MVLLLLKVLLGCIAAFMALRWFQSLSLGVARFGGQQLKILAIRREQPGSYWLIMAINAGAIAFFLWLVFR